MGSKAERELKRLAEENEKITNEMLSYSLGRINFGLVMVGAAREGDHCCVNKPLSYRPATVDIKAPAWKPAANSYLGAKREADPWDVINFPQGPLHNARRLPLTLLEDHTSNIDDAAAMDLDFTMLPSPKAANIMMAPDMLDCGEKGLAASKPKMTSEKSSRFWSFAKFRPSKLI